MRFLFFLNLAGLPPPPLWTEINVYLKDFFVNIFTERIPPTSLDILKIWYAKWVPLHAWLLPEVLIFIYLFCLFKDSANKAAVMFLVVCSQISAKGLSLLVSHKQRAAFYPKGFGRMLHHCGKVTFFWMSEGRSVSIIIWFVCSVKRIYKLREKKLCSHSLSGLNLFFGCFFLIPEMAQMRFFFLRCIR